MGRRVALVTGALVLLVMAVSSPLMGLAAAEHFKSRKLYGVLEGDWFVLFGLIFAAACVGAAIWVIRLAFAR